MLDGRARAQQHHEELFVRRQLAFAAIAERAAPGRAGGDRRLGRGVRGGARQDGVVDDLIPGEAGFAHHGRGELGGRQRFLGVAAVEDFQDLRPRCCD